MKLVVILSLLLGGALILSGILLYMYLHQRKLLNFLIAEEKKKNSVSHPVWDEEETEKLDLLRQRVDIMALQTQINPHFLYNTLDSIRSQALMDGQKDIANMTERLSRFFRYCISNKVNMVKLKEELRYIDDYYYIQKYRFEDRFDMSVEIEKEELKEFYIPKLTLQPLIENAIAHGLEKVMRKGEVKIRIFSTDSRLILNVEDNGIGIEEDDLIRLNERLRKSQVEVKKRMGKNNGIAVMNINSRIKLTFGEEYGIHYRSVRGEGTKVEVSLPLVDEFARANYEQIV